MRAKLLLIFLIATFAKAGYETGDLRAWMAACVLALPLALATGRRGAIGYNGASMIWTGGRRLFKGRW